MISCRWTNPADAPRQTNGALPYIAFVQLVCGSELVDAGTNVNFAFIGAAPDLGAFEYGLNPPPVLGLSPSGPDLIFTASGGPAGGTNYLLTTTNLTVPPSQWVSLATNQFDVTGGVLVTNLPAIGLSSSFYRLRLP